jgi:hypothetical protein
MTKKKQTPEQQLEQDDAPKLHVMLDLETWGTATDAGIMSIGAVKFDPFAADDRTHKFPDEFHVAIDVDSALRSGGDISGSTLLWWLDPDRRKALDEWRGMEHLDLTTALEGFSIWFGADSLPVWGNGAGFDNVILRSAYTKLGGNAPWHYHHDRCFRTLKALRPQGLILRTPPPAWDVIAHEALSDARIQARELQQIAAFLRLPQL